jgi:hypothetical protein
MFTLQRELGGCIFFHMSKNIDGKFIVEVSLVEKNWSIAFGNHAC